MGSNSEFLFLSLSSCHPMSPICRRGNRSEMKLPVFPSSPGGHCSAPRAKKRAKKTWILFWFKFGIIGDERYN